MKEPLQRAALPLRREPCYRHSRSEFILRHPIPALTSRTQNHWPFRLSRSAATLFTLPATPWKTEDGTAPLVSRISPTKCASATGKRGLQAKTAEEDEASSPAPECDLDGLRQRRRSHPLTQSLPPRPWPGRVPEAAIAGCRLNPLFEN